MTATNLFDAFSATVARHPDRDAFRCGDDSWTYSTWQRRADDFRMAYRRAGVVRGDRVLIWMSNSVQIAAAIVGAWAEDAIPALMDAACRAPQLENAVRTAAPRLVVRAASTALPPGAAVGALLVAEDVPPASLDSQTRSLSLPTDPASIVFTSGSTGQPKGVVQSHGNLIRACGAVASYLGVREDDVLLCPVPWSFDYGYGQLLSTAILGVTQVIPPAFTPFGICEALERHRPTVLAGLPALFTYLMGGMSPILGTDRSPVRLITNTGGQVPAPVLRSLRDAFPQATVVLNYGLTETYRSCYVPQGVPDRPGLIGRPIPGADVVIVREDGSLADEGEEGEIVHRGDYVCLGYWNDPEATARSVRPDPLLPAGTPFPGRAVYTGDYGYRDADGFVVYRGRRDHLLKSMGIRVSPGEIEHLLYESGLVELAAVFGRPHELLGHEVWAAVTFKAGVTDGRARLTRYARDVMTPAMLPRRYLYKDAMPRTTTGKIDYPALRAEADALAAG
ncbi:acyl-CoA ligase (AMP-forming), exosortase A system-associated [Luteitalea sp. TBR-22]|uniref:class I adenylate-forming enzyme family protein n=1 Tax=Luteitalea sp. TBR-22 TaxID=2802971 RepID=UPI001AF42950|nr:AMP-binding protein [Luteitalea sp. TBR-22]BCS31978.1 acyl-CoA ligase (AMP-forming), exosortase A system-associated [Luteitalea sp. TBR-22]